MVNRKPTGLAVLVAALLVLLALSSCPLMTLVSLKQVDDHPLYVMRYYGPYTPDLFVRTGLEEAIYGRMRQMTMPEAGRWFVGTDPGVAARW